MNAWRWMIVGVGLAGCSLAAAADWPQWRGPERNGISTETGLLKEWPKEGPPLVWQVKEIGDGYSTPAVVGERIYLISNEGMDNEYVQALATADGKEAWRTRIGKVGPNDGPQYPGSRGTPTVDGERLYALGSDGDLACLETATGKAVWQKNLRSDFDGQPGKWAYAESPLVDGDLVVCTPGGKEATIVALNKQTGETVWKSAVPGGDEAAYASIITVEAGGAKQYVQFLGKGLVGVDAKSGKFLWRYDRTAQGSPANIPTPVAREAFIYSGAGRSGGGLVELKAEADKVLAEEVYFTTGLPTAIGGSVLIDGHLYGTNSQALLCIEFATGKIKWSERGIGAASLCAAEGLLYLHGEDGRVALVEASPEAYREKGRFTPPDAPDRGRSKAWAYPVIAGGKLYVRDRGSLWCYDIQAK
ncbi:MAG: PQQ-binding-like beta-propeller repeat protein [Pirellulaceae bacterium]